MLVLFESASGYAIFKVLNEKKLQHADNLFTEFETPEKASKIVKLKHFEKFNDMKEALKVATASVEGKVNKKLKKLLKSVFVEDVQDSLAVVDAKLGNAISTKLNINCVSNSSILKLTRCIRAHASSLIEGLADRERSAMVLGLAHSLSRYKLKFSPDKVDTMVVQAIGLLDDLDKELNNYIMRCKEWYGWHFPELVKLVTDNNAYVRTVLALGMRVNAPDTDFSEFLPEDLEKKVKEVAEISMGTALSDEDILNIQKLGQEILEMQNYRTQLFEYLKNRMVAIAPNLTALVGEMVGARLISHAGSLMNLAKHPASTVQILGAEKALFRALKNKQDTPKYGLIYHAQLVGQTNQKLKGKIARTLAAKAAIACRVDALGEENDTTGDFGVGHRAKVERRIKMLEEGTAGRRLSGVKGPKVKREKYQNKSEVFQYKDAADSFLPSSFPQQEVKMETADENDAEVKDDLSALQPSTSHKRKKSDDGNDEPPKKKKKKNKASVKEEPEE